MPFFDEGGDTGAARSNVFNAIFSLFDKDRRKPIKGRQGLDRQDQRTDAKREDEQRRRSR